MSTGGRILDLRADPEADLGDVVAHLRAGGVIAYPTETVYGIGAACSAEGVAAVRALKGREADKPFLALIPSEESAAGLVWTAGARELASIFWPGSVTLVLSDPAATFPDGVRSPVAGTVGVRVTPHPVAARLVDAFGAPLISTSLNVPGEPPVTSGGEARQILARLGGSDVWLLDAGTLPPSPPSTVVDCTGEVPVVLRPGAVPVERLRCAIPETHERYPD
jgi:L-threonylcarbamoyladenylate synthase